MRISTDETVLLLDNGSVKPAATLTLRQLAKQLSLKSKREIQPVSLRHADRIDSDQLDGKPAQTLVPFLTSQLQQGYNKFILIPLFFSKNEVITSVIPEQVKILKEQLGDIQLRITDVVYPLPDGDEKLVKILFEVIHQMTEKHPLQKQNIVLVDHGSPSSKVTAVRQHIAAALQQRFNGFQIEQAVMERRDGVEYDFNGPLLENWLLQKAEQGERSAIVAMLFFLPGRHAGKGGDIEAICDRVKQQYPEFEIYITPLISEHSELIELLYARLIEV